MAGKAKDEARKSNVTDDTIRFHYETIEDLKDKATSAQGRVRAAMKAAKTAGITLKMLARVADEKRQEPDDVAQERADYERYTALLNGPLWALFEEQDPPAEPDAEVVAKVARYDATQQGVNAGRAGHPRGSNPFPQGSPAFAAFDTGWIQGDETKQAVEEHAKSGGKPPRRGRPRGAGKPADALAAAAEHLGGDNGAEAEDAGDPAADLPAEGDQASDSVPTHPGSDTPQ